MIVESSGKYDFNTEMPPNDPDDQLIILSDSDINIKKYKGCDK